MILLCDISNFSDELDVVVILQVGGSPLRGDFYPYNGVYSFPV